MEFLYLSQEDVISLRLELEDVITIIEKALAEHGKGLVELPPKPGVHPTSNSFIHAMPAYIPALKTSGIKWVSGFPDNHKKEIPQIMGILVLNDVTTGAPLVIMDARWVTAVRTAAVTAVTAKYCARSNSKTIGVIGAGVQGKFNVLALQKVMPLLKKVKIYDIQEKAVNSYVESMSKKTGLEIIPVSTPKEATFDSDIVITAAQRVEKPFMDYRWLKKGVFAVGLESGRAWGKTVKKMDKFVTDDWEQTKYFESEGSFPGGLPKTYTEIGRIIVGKDSGRMTDDEKIIACNVGLAIQDIAVGNEVYKLAQLKNVGLKLPLMESMDLF